MFLLLIAHATIHRSKAKVNFIIPEGQFAFQAEIQQEQKNREGSQLNTASNRASMGNRVRLFNRLIGIILIGNSSVCLSYIWAEHTYGLMGIVYILRSEDDHSQRP